MEDKNPKAYLDYIDKEMTIMGILSAFCAALALIFNGLLSAKKDTLMADVWNNGFWYLMAGSVSMLFAMFSFYQQRSDLAELYGQMSHGIAVGDNKKFERYMKHAQSWYSWIWYRTAGISITVSFLQYLLTLSIARKGEIESTALTTSAVVLPIAVGVSSLLFWLRRLQQNAPLPPDASDIVSLGWSWILGRLSDTTDTVG